MIMFALTLLATASSPYQPSRLSQHQLDAVSDGCSTPRTWLRNVDGFIHIQPDPTARYDQIDCVLAKLKKRHAGYMGFEGNEAVK
jgi:hypothetical protein